MRSTHGVAASAEVQAALLAALQRGLKGVNTKAVDQVVERMDKDPRLLRRFGGVSIRHAPLLLRAIGPRGEVALVRQAVGAARPREHRRSSRRRSSRASPSRQDDADLACATGRR